MATVSDSGTEGERGSCWRTRGIEVEDGLVVEVLLGHDGLDDMLHEVGMDLVVGDVGRVLRGDEDGVHADGRQSAALLLVLNSHLCLAVWSQPADCAVLAHLRTHALPNSAGGVLRATAVQSAPELP